jgi:hypothetical protein
MNILVETNKYIQIAHPDVYDKLQEHLTRLQTPAVGQIKEVKKDDYIKFLASHENAETGVHQSEITAGVHGIEEGSLNWNLAYKRTGTWLTQNRVDKKVGGMIEKVDTFVKGKNSTPATYKLTEEALTQFNEGEAEEAAPVAAKGKTAKKALANA